MKSRFPLDLGSGLRLPLDAVTETFAMLGVKGSGKSTTAKRFVEQLTLAGQQCVIIDPTGVWWGLKSSADGTKAGLPFTVLGGEHGDVPITGASGDMIGELAVTDHLPLVIDLSLMRKAEQRRFMLAFVETLYFKNREPMHLVVDECDLFVPQRPMKGEERLLGAMEDLVRRGRVKGIGVSLISQRPASINKDVLSQVSVLLAGRVSLRHDLDALSGWTNAHGDRERRDQMMADLAGLPTGTCWVWSPSFLDVFQRVAITKPETFDSLATPKAGQTRIVPKVLSPVDTAALRDKLAQVVEEAEQNDPTALRRRVVVLSRRVAELEAAAAQGAVTREVQVDKIVDRVVEVVPARVAAEVGDVERVMADIGSELSRQFDRLVGAHAQLCQLSAEVSNLTVGTPAAATPMPATAPARPVRQARPAPPPASPAPASPAPASPAPRPVAPTVDGPPLKAGARRILDAVARSHPLRLTKSQVGTLSRFKTSGGTFAAYQSALRTGGYVTIDSDGYWTATAAGLAAAGVDGSAPLTTDEVLDRWRQALKKGARDMLDTLIGCYPNSMSRSELGDALGMTYSGGSFNAYLSTLRSNGLIDVDGQNVTASDTLFLLP